MLGDVIAEMVHEPRLVVRVHESQFDAVNARIHDITAQKAYAGKVVVLADAANCRRRLPGSNGPTAASNATPQATLSECRDDCRAGANSTRRTHRN